MIVNKGNNSTRSLHLLGSPVNSAVVTKNFVSNSTVAYFQFSMKTDGLSTGSANVAEGGFYNSDLNRFFPKIAFKTDGTIMAEEESSVLVGFYQPYAWYDVKLVLNKSSRSYNVSIAGPNIKMTAGNLLLKGNPGDIQSLALAGGWGGTNVYFDNTRVIDVVPGVVSGESSQAVSFGSSTFSIWLPRISLVGTTLLVMSIFLPGIRLQPLMPLISYLGRKKAYLGIGAVVLLSSSITWYAANYFHAPDAMADVLIMFGALGPVILYYVTRRDTSKSL